VSNQIIKIPDIGGAEDAEVIEICVAVGDEVAQEDSLVVLETDKASMEVPAPVAGKVVSIAMSEGDSVSEGDIILELAAEGDVAEVSAPVEESKPEPEPEPEPVAEQAPSSPQQSAVEGIKVPDLGGGAGAEVIEVCVAVGDEIGEGDSLIVLETDKASMEVPAPKAGKVVAISLAEGSTASEGDLILDLEVLGSGETTVPASAPVAESAPTAEPAKVAAAPLSASPVQVPVRVPDLGGATEVTVIEVSIAVGDEVDENDSLIVLETDKASMEIPAPKAGKIVAVHVAEGGSVNVGDAILDLEVAGEAPVAEPIASNDQSESVTASEKPSAASAAVAAKPSVATPSGSSGKYYAGPAVRKLCREFGVELEQVPGTGPKGRVLKEDVQVYVKSSLANKGSDQTVTSGTGIPSIPEIDFSQFGEVDVQKMSKLHKVTAMNMQRAWLNVPHVTQFDDADITDLEDFRKTLKAEAEKRGVKVTPLPFLLKACAAALKAYPQFNASLHADGEHIVYKKYIHIGVAVDTPAGLVVPVLRDVDTKSVWELSAEMAELGAKAKNRKLKPADMQGGCFTISSLGGIGGQGFTPIVNAPEVAILGVSKLSVKPVWNGSEFMPRKMLPLALSYDHRAVNGADAGRFFTYLGELLADIRRLAL
jgi:pyruvate dehydrogenase E2 component (dihydrolipoamide acetyltransferase)